MRDVGRACPPRPIDACLFVHMRVVDTIKSVRVHVSMRMCVCGIVRERERVSVRMCG